MLITSEGTIIRTPVSSINVYSRTAGGVIVMRLAEGASLIGATRIEREEEIEEESAKVDATDSEIVREEQRQAKLEAAQARVLAEEAASGEEAPAPDGEEPDDEISG